MFGVGPPALASEATGSRATEWGVDRGTVTATDDS